MKKIKQQYRNAIIEGAWRWYPSLRNSCHKSFSTKQEKSTYAMHCIEYKGSMLKLRAARGFCLVDSWDDLPTSAYKLGKSWKHNSRRKHQYYRE